MNVNKAALYKILTEFKELSEQEMDKVSFREILNDAIEDGEIDDLDFKEKWIGKDKLSKIILAMANYGGGSIIFGVSEKDNEFHPVGLDKYKDNADIIKEIEEYLPINLIDQVVINKYSYNESEYKALEGKKFQVLSVTSEENNLPYLSIKEGDKVHKNRIYTRRGTNTAEANSEEIEKILERKIHSIFGSRKQYDLEVHLKQLKELYQHISKTHRIRVGGVLENFSRQMQNSLSSITGYEEKRDNVNYPELSFEEFIKECIEDKQKRIRHELDI